MIGVSLRAFLERVARGVFIAVCLGVAAGLLLFGAALWEDCWPLALFAGLFGLIVAVIAVYVFCED